MGFEIILTVILIVVIVLFVLSFIGGFIMFDLTLKPKSDKNIFKKKEKDITNEQKQLHEKLLSWTNDNMDSVWNISTFDNLNLKARYFKGTAEHKWVIVVHGYTSVGWHMSAFAKEYLSKGYSVLMPDLRGHGISEGEYATMGYYDSVDIIEWIYEIIKKDPEACIVLHGVSMGAATVMMVTGEDIPVHVKCVIEDCGYTSVWEVFKHNMKRMFKLPAFPILYTANIISSAKIKMDFKEVSPLKAVSNSKTPILFIHGDQDVLVPFKMLNILYENASCEKDYLVIKGAVHGEASAKEPDTYYEKVSGFIDKYIN